MANTKDKAVPSAKPNDVGVDPANTTDFTSDDAAVVIQRAWRARRNTVLNSDARWGDVAIHARLQAQRDAASSGKNDPKTRWTRGFFLASRLQDSDKALKESGGDERELVKILETQHWLELTDSKHRYGSNLKYYHRKWLEEDTTDNFFKWLDRGAGKDLSCPELPREVLEKERIIYLSAEQRMNYLVKIDEKGHLRWARNNEIIDTTNPKWQDSGDGSGIVISDSVKEPSPLVRRRTSFEDEDVSYPVSAGEENKDTHNKSADGSHQSTVKRWASKYLHTKSGDSKASHKKTWIYVADKHFNLFVGIKDRGTFQHSSFLAGGIVASAGLISIHNGVIHKLTPHSGHYRTTIDNFREFVDILGQKGVDTRHVEVAKAELTMWSMQHVNNFKKAKRAHDLKDQGRSKSFFESFVPGMKDALEGTEGTAHNDQWKWDILTGRRDRAKPNVSTS